MKRISLLIAVLCCLLLTACSDLSVTGYDILSPPRMHGDRSALQELIIQSAGGTFTPVYPASGEYQNAVIERDVNGDGTAEAIAFCRTKDDTTLILCCRKSDTGYESMGKALLRSAVISTVDFADLDGDGTQELIVLYPDADSPRSSLTVVSIHSAVTQADMPASYNAYIISDLDGDQARDILLLSQSSAVGSATASLLGFSRGVLSVRSSCEMDSQTTDYTKITCGAVSAGVNGVFVDGCSAQGEYTTQVLYYDAARDSLTNPLFIYSGYDSTRRTERISCGDIDGDGLIEFPVCSLCDCGEKEAPETVCRRLTWNNYRIDDMELISKKTAILCANEGFLFNIDDVRVGSVTARYTAPDTVALYAWEYSEGEMRCTDLLLTLRRYSKESYSADTAAGIALTTTSAAVYTYEINPAAGVRSYTDDEVKRGFTAME